MQLSEVVQLVADFDPAEHAKAVADRQRTLELLHEVADPFSRQTYDPGHITASGIVFDPDERAVVLVFHKRLERWLQPGGHVESADESIIAAARREIAEETGLTTFTRWAPRLVWLDVHPIPARRGEPAHFHFDLMFHFVAADTDLALSEESHRVVWAPLECLQDFELDDSIRNALARSRRPA